MKMRRSLICFAFFMIAVVSQCSEARHAIERRSSDFSNEDFQNDESSDYNVAQNDADGGNDADEEEIVGRIESRPENYSVTVGQTVRLECRVVPSTVPVVSWYRGTDPLYMGKTPMTSQKEKYVLDNYSPDLLIKDLQVNDTGYYTCSILQTQPVNVTHFVQVKEIPRITDGETSTVASVEVDNDQHIDKNMPRIISFSASPKNHVHEGSDLLLTCNVTGVPTPSIVWSRQRKFGPGGTESLTSDQCVFSAGTCFMRNVTKHDAGTYYCYAINDGGSDTKKVNIVVSNKPHVKVHKHAVNVNIGATAELICSSDDEPASTFRWFKDNQEIATSPIYTRNDSGSVSKLFVTPKTDNDFGQYTCEASNIHGSHSRSIELVERPVVMDLNADGPKLSWIVESHQPLESIEVNLRQLGENAEWITEDVPLPDKMETPYKLIHVLNTENLAEGEYEATVKVTNTKGTSEDKDPVIIKIVGQAQAIHTAGVFPTGDATHSIRPASFILNIVMMYLLVRML